MFRTFCFAGQLIEDITSRLADSGIREVTSFTKRGLSGYTDGDYTYYRFNVTVRGSEKSIRKFIKIYIMLMWTVAFILCRK